MENKKVKKPKSKVRKIIEWIGTGILGVVFLFASVCNISKWITSQSDPYKKGNSFGYSSYIVLTESMDPVYPVNSAIITYKEKPEKIIEQFNEIKDLGLDEQDEKNINLTFVDAYSKQVKSSFARYTNQTENVKDGSGQPMVMTHQLFEVRVNEDVEEGEGKYLFFVHGINHKGVVAGENQYQVFSEKELLGVVKMKSNFIGGVSRFLSSLWGLFICLLIPCLYIVITCVLDIFKAYHSDDEEEKLATEGASGDAPKGNNIDNMSKEDYEKLKQEMINEMLNGKGK